MKLTILIDNKAKEGLESEHGLSFLIEVDNRRILFDTGKGNALQHNTEVLGISLKELDAVILSHGHYDHTGGIPFVLMQNQTAPVYFHPAAFKSRFTVRGNEARPISMTLSVKEALQTLPGGRLYAVDTPVEIFAGMGITGPIPRINDWEDTGGPFFTDINGTVPDLIEDDLSVWVQTTYGIVVVTGCCHAGLINTLQAVQQIHPEKKIRAVIGGFHLLEASEDRLSRTIDALKNISPSRIIPCHCTGGRQTHALEQSLGGLVTEGRGGEVFRF